MVILRSIVVLGMTFLFEEVKADAVALSEKEIDQTIVEQLF